MNEKMDRHRVKNGIVFSVGFQKGIGHIFVGFKAALGNIGANGSPDVFGVCAIGI